MLAKSLSFLAGADAAGIVLGARVPIILTSRADSDADAPRLVRRRRRWSRMRAASSCRAQWPETPMADRRSSSSTPARRASSSRSSCRQRRRARAAAARADRGALHRAALRRQGRRGHERRRARRGPRARSSATTARSTHLVAFLRERAGGATARRRRPPRRPRRHATTRRRCASTQRVLAALDALRAARAAAPAAQPRADPCVAAARARTCRRSPASTPRSTARNPELAQMFALPHELHEAGVRRYGFHGLSLRVHRLGAADGRSRSAAAGRTVVLHLGNGASMCALHGGRSVASTMGFTAVDGLPMGTRCGSLDPGVRALPDGRARHGCARDREAALPAVRACSASRASSSDMRTLLAQRRAARAARDRPLRLPHRAASSARSPPRSAGSTRSSSPPASARTRRRSARAFARDAAWLGVELDAAANAAGGPRISAAASRVPRLGRCRPTRN